MAQVVLIAHNLRSAHNVGSLLRTADGLGVMQVYLTGYTPYPLTQSDDRMPHIAAKVAKNISKTALGAEETVDWQHGDDVMAIIDKLRSDSFVVCALEQADGSISIRDYTTPDKVAVLVGREVEGVEPEVLAVCDVILEIPMVGKKESFNVAQAAAMALYQLTKR
jgi:23S rRNA (guanosine2251-2'-O)-methyltransferase